MTTAADQAANEAALAEETAMFNVLLLATGHGGMDGLKKAGLSVVARVKKNLSHPGTGAVYKHGNVTHRASAPGDPPAVDTGRLRASFQMVANDAERYVDVGTNVTYAPFQEYGTSRIAARPYFRPAIEQSRAELQAAVVAEVVKAEQEALKAFGGAIGRLG